MFLLESLLRIISRLPAGLGSEDRSPKVEVGSGDNSQSESPDIFVGMYREMTDEGKDKG